MIIYALNVYKLWWFPDPVRMTLPYHKTAALLCRFAFFPKLVATYANAAGIRLCVFLDQRSGDNLVFRCHGNLQAAYFSTCSRSNRICAIINIIHRFGRIKCHTSWIWLIRLIKYRWMQYVRYVIAPRSRMRKRWEKAKPWFALIANHCLYRTTNKLSIIRLRPIALIKCGLRSDGEAQTRFKLAEGSTVSPTFMTNPTLGEFLFYHMEIFHSGW